MKNKHINKTLRGKSGKDLVSLLDGNKKQSEKKNSLSPKGVTEAALFGIWENLLGHTKFGVSDDFFTIGGNSIKAIQLLSRIASHFQLQLEATDIFLNPTIRQLAVLVGKKQNGHPAHTGLVSLEKQDRPAFIPLSFSQERLLFIDSLEGSVQYNLPAVIRLKGKLNKEALAFAFQQIVNRHEVLRTVFPDHDDAPYQYIREKDEWHLGIADGSIYKDNGEELKKYVQQLISAPFDLSKDHMLRADLISLEEEDNLLVLTMHHIASDGWSTSVFVKEMIELYDSYVKGKPLKLAELEFQYSDFAIWQRNDLQGDLFEKKISYWKEKLEGWTSLQLPTDYSRPSVLSVRGAKVEFSIDKKLSEKLELLSRRFGSTLFMTLLSVFKVLLYRYSGQQDICVGTPVAGRQHRVLEGLIGFFVNTLVLRSELNGNTTFEELLQQVKSNVLEGFNYQDVPFEKVVEAVVKEREMSRNPLFQVMFVFQNTPEIENLSMQDVKIFRESEVHNTSKFELTFSFEESHNGLLGEVEYSTDLYKEETIRRMIDHLKELLSAVAETPDQSIGSLSMLTKSEEQQLLSDFNNTRADYPKDKTMIGLFEEQVERTPANTAIIFEKQHVTYKELNERSNQLANYLLSRGVKEETLIPICIDRSIEMIVGILGVLKAGGSYLPIDPDYPLEMKRYMLDDSNPFFIIADEGIDLWYSKREGQEIIYPGTNKEISQSPADNVSRNSVSDHIICVIYTSGSSGKPKGVKVCDAGMVNRLYWMWETYPFEEHEKCVLKTSLSFGDHIWELFGPLNSGICSVLLRKADILDLDVFIEKLSSNKITRLVLVPSLLRTLLTRLRAEQTYFEHLKYWTCSGETLTYDLIEYFYELFPKNHYRLLNIYGSTEVSADVTCYDTSSGSVNQKRGESSETKFYPLENNQKNLPIGKPIANCKVYILDKENNLLPIGLSGEICIGGVPVGEGYLNRPDLTAEKFIKDPFSNESGALVYRTGDLGRWLPDGNIEYMGREDYQVKIRGFRVELGEIENELQQCNLIRDAVVLARDDKEGMKRLVGYVVPVGKFDKKAIVEYLKSKLPDYMVPALWLELEAMPLTPSGKIDKKVLPDVDVTSGLSNEYAAPRNETESRLSEIWKELLHIEMIGIYDNFFELGGQSLLAMRLISSIRKELKSELSVRDLFMYPTIKGLSEYIRHQEKVTLLPVIESKQRPDRIPLSFTQERLWFIDRLEGSIQYHISAVLKLKGKLNRDALAFALQNIVNRHEALRTVILEDKGEGYQVIKDKDQWSLQIADGSKFKQDSAGLENFVKKIINTPFDLSKDHMLRVNLISIGEDENVLAVTMHHISSDGWSISLIIKELVELYESKKLDYWKKKLNGTEPLLLPTDHNRPSVQSVNGAAKTFNVDRDLTEQLQLLSRNNGTTLFMTLLAVYNVLLYRYSGQEDICVGSPAAGRHQSEVENLIGAFINTLALRNEINSDSSFTELLNRVRATTLEAYENQEAPFEKVVDAVVSRRNLGKSPLFQVMFFMQNTPEAPQLKLGEVILTMQEHEHTTSQVDLTLNITETSEGLQATVEYCTDLFDGETIDRMIIHFKELLNSVVTDPNQKIGLLPMLTKPEERQLLEEFNDTYAALPEGKSFLDLFEERALRNPDNTAVVFENQRLTYKELNERSNQLAHYLQRKGIKNETLVPICIERSIDMLVGLLGISKSGGTFIPIDPDYPNDRIRFMLEDAEAKTVIFSNASRKKFSDVNNIEVINSDEDWSEIKKESTDNIIRDSKPDQLVYVIYTSGSTGKPKGVMIENVSLVNLLLSITDKVKFNSGSVFLSVTTFSFDISYLELFVPLINGGKLIIASREVAMDGYRLAKIIHSNRPTHMQGTPSTWQLLIDSKWKNEEDLKILVGGEALSESLKDKLTMLGYVVNLYGPTETTIWSTAKKLYSDEKVLIGTPVANTYIQILSKENQLVPVGVTGEIMIGGLGLARGYLYRDQLTSEKFIADPFSKVPGVRIYKTGDSGRWLADGNIDYIGRMDEQIKIRGYRIELGEIENVLQQSGLVRQCVILAKEDNAGSKKLVGYIVPEGIFDKQKITSYLRSKLPEYMVPLILTQLESFPLTPNGKINKKALPDPDLNELMSKEYIAPRNEIENKLALIWQKLLNIKQAGVNDDFFESGGHSLLAMRLIASIRAELGLELAIKDLFQHPTISELAAQLESESKASLLPAITVQPRPEHIPLSYSQERLWFIDRMEGSIQYHVPAVLELHGKLNIKAIEYAFWNIVSRHEILRSAIRNVEGVGYQYVKKDNKWKLHTEYGAKYRDDPEKLHEYIKLLINTPYDLSEDYMLRGQLISLSEEDHVLIVTLHHIASDGWSVSVIVRELAELYSSFIENREPELLPLPLQYADYALWQRNYLKGEVLEKKLDYWVNKLDGVAMLQLPTDFRRPERQSFNGAFTHFKIEKDLADKLQDLSQQNGTTLYMILLAAFKVMLYRYSGQHDICVGSPIAGRQQQEIEGLIGFFVNSLALRSNADSDLTFREFLQQVRTTTLEAYENQEVPFETVVDAVVNEREVNRNPLFQVMFALQNTPEVSHLNLGDIQIKNYTHGLTTSKFDFTFYLAETALGLDGMVEYSTDLYSEQTIERMIDHFKELLSSIVQNPEESIGSLSMLTYGEKHQLLAEFNDTYSEYPRKKSITELFDEQVLKTPDSTAIVYGQEKLTYKKFNEHSNQLANYLIERGVRPGESIGLFCSRSNEMIIGMFGILKAGCAYVPFNTDYPAERLSFIIEDTGIKNIVTVGKDLYNESGLAGYEVIDVKDSVSSSKDSPEIKTNSESCAYVMFTSGTTGRPKGIAVSHKNIIKLVYDTGEISVKPEDRILQWSNYSFDGSTYDIYSSLLTGASLYIIKDNRAADVDELASMIKEQKITIIFVTTALFNTFIDINPHSLKGLRKILFGGEMVSPSHVRKALAILGEGKIVHVYGPTETTVYAIGYPLDTVREDDVIPIGKPLSNTSLFVLNDCSRLVPVGVSGELFIGGDGVSQGYVNNSLLTQEKYLPNPFSKDQNEKMYRTGDIVKWLPDGNIVYLGREDDQVKIRGYRIELGEIESLMNKLDEVSSSCVVIVQDQAATNKLVAYYIPAWEEVKLREVDLYQKHIDNWNELYEIEYSKADQTEDTDYEFNIIGWNDSFTGQPIPKENMRVWLDDIVDVILADKPKRVLEIGCGTGLIYYKLTGHIQNYIGIDFSEVSVNQIRNQIAKAEKDYPPTELKVGFAHEVKLDKDETVDMIILNSIVQYFPGEKYLSDILAKSIPMLKGKGKIIIGDVRDNRLLKSFKGRLHLAKSKETLSAADFNWAVEQEVSREEELCFSPEYFYNLRHKYPEITHIEIQWKDGDYENELTLYRFTATIYAGIEKDLIKPDWQTWNKETGSDNIIEKVNNGNSIIAIKDLPNPRLSKEILLEKGMKDKSVRTVGDLSEYINRTSQESVEINEMISIAKSKGYKCRFFLDDDPFKINLFMQKGSQDVFVKQDYNYDADASAIYTSNVPLLRDIFVMLKKDIQELLKNQLPDYMIPSELVALQNFPLNSNGKIDRNFLKKSEEMFRSSSINYKPPVTESEHELTAIWKELLGVDRIEIHDNFFELGGHSLLAMRVVSAIRKQMEIEIAIKDIFLCPTISELGLFLEAQSKGLVLSAITVQEKPARIPLSFSQERLWFIDQLEGSIQYHVPSIIEMKGKLNKEGLENSLKSIIDRHEVLRSVILESEGTGYQVIKNSDKWKLNIVDGSGYKDANEGLQNYIRDLINIPFDLSKDYMLRGNLIRLSEDDHVLVIVLHHIASDGWSTSIMVRELVELYKSYEENREAKLIPLQIQYVDYAVWQRNNLQGAVLEKRLEYWKEKLKGVEQLQLPSDYSRPVIQSVKGADKEFSIDLNLASQLKDLSQKNGCTLFMTLLSAFKVLLYRYSGQEDICVGSPTAGRQQKEIEELIGFFVNTLALRSEVRSEAMFTELLEQVRLTTLEAYQYQDAPFEKVVEAIVSNRDMSRSPLFQVMFVLQNTPEVPELNLGELNLNIEEVRSGVSKFDLTFYMVETPFGLKGTVEYCTDLYNEQTIERMTGHFKELLKSVVKDPQQKVGSIPMLTKSEEHQLLTEFNDTAAEYPEDGNILDLFEEHVLKTPDKTAIVFEDQHLTYKELNERSNQLAHYLESIGIKKEALVPVCIERSTDMLVAILGVLKSGGAFVPIDPGYPEERIRYMLEDTGTKIVLTSEASRLKIPETGNIEIIEINGDQLFIDEQGHENLQIGFKPDDLAYVIYTSGSTGKPKGVMIEHRSLVNLLLSISDKVEFNSDSVFLSVTTFSFDICYLEFFLPLINGGKLVIASREVALDGYRLSESISANRPTHMQGTPSTWQLLIESDWQNVEGIKILAGGEALKEDLKNQLTKLGPAINLYGPTETTIWSTVEKLETGKKVLIGSPIANTTIRILDKDNGLVPVGVNGEILIGGLGLARGYLNKNELTAEKFIADPFSTKQKSRLYRTGDTGRWLPDGSIECFGRIDTQVKIRGYRIELGEIESMLQESDLIQEAAVLAKEDKNGNKRLVGYLVPKEVFYKDAVVAFLKSKLPEYMVPALWMELDSLPLTPNGKINRKALPDPDISDFFSKEFVPPRNETEEKLAEIWQDLLGLERIGINDNFFELGGHSLLAMRVISSIRRELKSELSIRDLFMHPIIAELSLHLESQSKQIVLPEIEVVHPRPEYIPLSFSQERLWFLDRLEGSIQYHIPEILRFKGKLNTEALTHSMQSVISRHEVLRTVIREEDGKAHQVVMHKDNWELQFVDGSQYNENVKGLQNHIQELISLPFDLSEDYMVRGHLIRLNDNDHVLVITFHHISSDGWSRSIIVKELTELYSSYEEGREANLQPLQLQYADYAIWQHKYLQGEVLDSKLDYWKKKLEGSEPLRLATDYSRPPVHSTKGSSVEFSVDKDLSEQLQLLSQHHGVTMFMTLLTVYKVLLYRYSGQQDICVGIGIAGRQQQEVEKLIGFFVNTLALRSELNSDLSFTDLLQQVKETTMEAYEHQEAPFEKVVDATVGERDMSRNPLVQVMFVLQNTPEIPELRLKELSLSTEVFASKISKFDLTLFMAETPFGLQGSVEYCTDLYSEETINRITGHFKELLRSVVTDQLQKIGSLPMLTKSEKHQLLVDFNKTEVTYPKCKSIVELFEKQVANNPEALALVFENEQLTYKELNERSNRLAHYLLSKGVKKETMVPVCIERSMEMITAILGILKAGGAYVPIDPEYPLERIKYMLEDTGAKVIVTNKDSRSKLQTDDRHTVIELDTDWEDISNYPSTQLQTSPEPDHLAYIIYTSGSTGMPKGVMIEHRGVVNLSLSQTDALRLKPEMKGLQFASIGFDASCYDIFNTLLSGGCLVLCKKEDILSAEGFEKLINKHNVEIGTFPPSFLNVIKDSLGTIRTVVSAGEALNEELGNYIQSKGIRLVNAYGPTETTVCATLTDNPFRGNNITSIGTPVSNLKVYILDRTFNLCPVGVMGEICVEGIQLARGYLNRQDLTDEKFIKNPFGTDAGSRLYRTGDLGKWLPDGNIEYLGRIDDQVKIRGHRIELGEIESVLNNLKMVSSSCVVINQDQAITNKLAAYYIPAQEEVKLRESDLYQKRIETWKELYETEDIEEEDLTNQDSEFDIKGWNDSFTGNQIPSEQMQKWLDDTVRVILSEKPERVLEIGCGTGLIYYRLVGHIQKYTGIDLSKVYIDQITRQIGKADKEYPPTDLKVCYAHEVEVNKNETVDTIILNSIVQYFPGEKYLSDVLEKSISILKGKGRIIVGDVRDNRLLKLFKSRLYLQQSKDSLNIQDFKWGVEQELSREEELCLSPEYFYDMRSKYPEITHIDIQWKQGDYVNELSLYRYTVIIYVGVEKELIQPDWQSWGEIKNKESVIEKLNNGNTSIALKNIPNSRLSREILLERGLMDKSIKTVRDLSDYITETSEESTEINDIISAATDRGYQYRLMLDEDPLKINLLLTKPDTFDGFVKQEYNYNTDASANSVKSNVPLLRDIYSLLKKDIQKLLKAKLPDYMIPSELTALQYFPLTASGKIDRSFLRKFEEKEGISNKYEAPRNETEWALAGIWQDLLGLELVGINDNFFELGGDSIITIQFLSRARRLGYELKPKDIFIHQTIGSLSAVVAERSATVITGEQGILTGRCGLIPIQQWYFEGAGDTVSHFNQAVLLSIDKSVTQEELGMAAEQLTERHDALRFRYYREDDQWNQEYGMNKGVLTTLDLKSAKKNSFANLIKEHADKYQSSLNIEKGELVKFVLIQTPTNQTHNRILIVIHHLAVDGVSWRILLDDLELLLAGIRKGKKAELGPKSSSYRQWYNALESYSQSKRLLSQIHYWEKVAESYEPLVADKEYAGIVKSKDVENFTIKLDADQTKMLLQDVPRVYHTEINDMLLCALALTLCEWSSKEKIVIGLEGHGRESISESIDTSRTLGWFTSLYPLLLELTPGRDISDSIKTVKEQLRRVPDKGLGYGVLKYINKSANMGEKLSGRDCWDIVFNYLGQLDNVVSSGKILSVAVESSGVSSNEEQKVSHLISVNSFVQGGELSMNWSYSSLHYEKKTITELIKKYQETLESVITHCIEKQKSDSIYTPSDFGLGAEINYEELDRFLEKPYRGIARKESVQGLYRLSGLQEGMLFHALYDSKAAVYIEQISCDLSGPDLEIFSNSWEHVLRNHSVLRSAFYYDEFSIPVQCVYRDVGMPVTILDYRDMNQEEQKSAIKEYKKSDCQRGFDFKSAPLMRIALLRLSDDRYKMILSAHHILFDGWSNAILMEEFLNIYELQVSGKEIPYAEEDRFEDYIRYIERGDMDQQESYWRNYMNGIDQSTLLPFIGTTTQRTKGVGDYESIFLNLDNETKVKAEQFAQRHRLTLNTVMQGVWSYLLHQYTGSNDIVYGIAVSGRPDNLPGIEKRVGMYVNTLPFHSTIQKDREIVQWLKELQSNQISSVQYQYTPLNNIQRWTGVSGDLFDSLLVFENYPVNEMIKSKQWSLRVENFMVEEQTNFPLTIMIESSEEINVRFSYNSEILKNEYVKKIREHFNNVLIQITSDEVSSAGEINLLSKSEEHQLLVEFNNTAAEYPKNISITDLFEEQAEKTPDRIALVFDDKNLTYKELNEKANQLAHYLKSKGVTAETPVPICMERGMEMIIGIIGILKAGGAYVPVDPHYPAERISFMLEDSGAEVMISSKDVRLKLPVTKKIKNIVTDTGKTKSEINKQPVHNLKDKVSPENLIYVLYTSGSTGNPKGVRMPGSSLVNLLLWQDKQFVNNQRRVLQFTSLNFDVSFQEIFSTLCFGSTLCLISRDRRIDMSEVLKDIDKYKITHLFVPYIVLKNLAEVILSGKGDSYSLEEIITAGEQLKLTNDINELLEKSNINIVNQYGPTETHVVSSYKLERGNELPSLPPIGKPVDNTQLYVADESGQLVPIGVPGELYIGGVQLARGYLNLTELTKEKFIQNPFENKDSIVYRTGDLVRWLPDGNIEYLGRIDDQVKIRGYRVEPGEIESAIQESGLVSASVVIAKEDKDGNKRLIGYVVADEAFDKDGIILYLKSRLPEYMVPAFWVELESIPVTPNGKTDKKALPDPDITMELSNQYEAPRNETEEKLAAIWKELMGLERIGVNDNFFELGGHSLLATRAVSLIEKEFSINIPVKALFDFTSISELGKYIKVVKSNKTKRIESDVFDL
ncbi:MAG: non-ribosomal peptide synthase/polyketide synthase [Ignavibacteria bacterium]|nr:non-ribosomal peptide synthase/polyketide synthase [Ignavibacteria bacterium]